MKQRIRFLCLTLLVMVAGMAAAQDTYTVVGSSSIVNGSEAWNVSNTDNDMIPDGNGNYTLIIPKRPINAGTYDYKVIKNHDYDNGQWGNNGSNASLTINENGTYTIVFKFNTNDWRPSAIAIKTASVAGSATGSNEGNVTDPLFGRSWNPATNDMTLDEDGRIFKLRKEAIALSQGNVAYKIALNHSWNNAYPSQNAILSIPEDGVYDCEFTFDLITNEVNATAKKCVAKIGNAYYSTLQAAVDAAKQMGGSQTINIIDNITEETVTIPEVANFKLTIDGQKDASSNYTVDATIVVDGLRQVGGGSPTNGASVTLQNIAFVKTTATVGVQAKSYSHDLTIQDCTYSGYNNDKWFLDASVDGPLYGVTVKNVTVEKARLIYGNLANEALFQNITATNDIKVGFNVKTSGTALIENCQVTTAKYAFRDYSDGYAGTFTLKDNTFISTSEADDEGVIVNRGGSDGTAHINVESGTYTGHLKVLSGKEGMLAISGGYFSEEFPQSYIAADLVAQDKICVPATDKEGYFTIGDPHYVAKIGEKGYVSLAAAVAAVPTDGTEMTITMIEDHAVSSGITIAAGKNIILELNGKVVSYNSPEGNTQALITNRGTLVIQDNTDTSLNGTGTGLIGADYTNPDTGEIPGYASNTITNCGTLTLKSGKIVNTATGGAACYVIDNNNTTNNAILNIEGGYVYRSRSQAVRMYCNSTTLQNTLNISGGIVEGGYAGFWTQLAGSESTNKKPATINITGGEVKGGTFSWYDYSYGDSFEAVEYNISGGKFTGSIYSYAVNNGVISGFISGGLFSPEPSSSYIKPAGYMFGPSEEVEGYYVLVPAEVDYSWIENNKEYHDYLPFNTPFKKKYLMNGETITLLQNITLTEDLTWITAGDAAFTLNFGEYSITKGNFSIILKSGQRVNTDKTTSVSIFSAADEGYLVKSTKDENGKYYYTVEEPDLLYTTLNGVSSYKFWSNTVVSGSGTYKLLKDITAPARIVPGAMASDVTLDLNGHTLTSTANDFGVQLSRAGTANSPKTFNLISSDGAGKLLLTGITASDPTDAAISVSGKYNNVTIGENVTVDGGCVVMLSENQTLTVEGNINGGDDFAVVTNGSTTKNTNITIKNGAVLTSNEVAMYLPGTGTTTIEEGAKITGSTGIYVKSATLNIEGGEITGNGATAEYTYNGNGCNSTGQALVVDNCNYPGGVPTVNITGGKFTTVNNASAIGSYANGDGVEPVGEFVHGGYFSTELPIEICEAGKKTVPSTTVEGYYELGDVVYVAQIDETHKYETLQAALDAAHEMTGDVTVTLLKDIAEYAIVHQKAGLNLTIDGADMKDSGNIIVDGNGKASGTETLNIQNFKFEGDGTDFCDGTTSFVEVPSTKDSGKPYTTGAYNYAHNITVTNCSFTSTTSGLTMAAVRSTSAAGAYNIVISECTGTNLHSLAQLTGTTGGGITGNTVSESESFVNVSGGGGEFTISGNTFTSAEGADGYGVRENASSTADLNLTDNTFTATNAVVLGKGNSATAGTINVISGTYVGEISKTDAATGKIVISGGHFSAPLGDAAYANFIAEGLTGVNGIYPDTPEAPNGIGTAVATVTNGEIVTYFGSLEAAFAAAVDGNTITLLANTAGNGIQVLPGRFTETGVIVDFNDFTYTMDGTLVGSTGTQTQAFQLQMNNKITFKNGAITSEKAKMLIQNYSDLTLEGMTLTLDNENYTAAYTLSNNNGTVVIDGTTINANPAGGFAFDVCRGGGGASVYKSVNVTVTGESVINGDIEIDAKNGDPVDGLGLTLESGTINGDLSLTSGAKAALNDETKLEKTVITKDNDIALDAPEGFKWVDNDDGTSTLKPESFGIYEIVHEVPYPFVEGKPNAEKVTYKRTFKNNIKPDKARYRCWFVPFNYTVKEEDLQYFDFFKIHMIAGSKTSGIVENVDNIYIYLTKVEAGTELKGNRPYVIRPNVASFPFYYEFVEENVDLLPVDETSRKDVSTSDYKFDFYGIYDDYAAIPNTVYTLNTSGQITKVTASNVTLRSYTWRMTATNRNDDYANFQFIFVEGDPNATDISGQFVDNNDEIEGIFSVGGMKLQNPTKGLNVIKYKNGKTEKVFIK